MRKTRERLPSARLLLPFGRSWGHFIMCAIAQIQGFQADMIQRW